jgi:hypothetical protein
VKHWFSNRKSTVNRTSNTAFQGWLEGFRRPANPPRKLALHKFYMQQEDFKDAVQELFDQRWPNAGLEKKEALSFRCKLAQELLDVEDPEVVEELIQQQNAEHEEALQEYQDRATTIANPDAVSEEDQQK